MEIRAPVYFNLEGIDVTIHHDDEISIVHEDECVGVFFKIETLREVVDRIEKILITGQQ